jgi:L-alanine-DL-glutamate epimerase-like enolase superfamily enzyme
MLDLSVTNIERTTAAVPFRPIPARNNVREIPHWTYFEFCKVTLHGGAVGWGESMLFYTWGATSDDAVKRAWGKNAAELMWDDSLGCGLQQALFDAVGKAAGVPVWALMGAKVRDRVPVSWWNIDMSPADWAAEVKTMVAKGYAAYKTKGRPWWDLYDQLDALAAVVPPGFAVDLDFNDMLIDADGAARILPDLEKKYPFLKVFESPIRQADVEGGKKVRAMTKVEIALHYGTPPPATAIKEDLCNGFVVSGGTSAVMRHGRLCEETGKKLWLQLVGTGLTGAFSLHLGTALKQAVWPAVNCFQLFEHEMLTESIRIENGTAAAPGKPGLGYEVDEAALRKFRVEKPKECPPGPRRLIKVTWPGGGIAWYWHGRQCFDDFRKGHMPFFRRGVKSEVWYDDGSEKFRDLHDRARKEPVYEGVKFEKPPASAQSVGTSCADEAWYASAFPAMNPPS